MNMLSACITQSNHREKAVTEVIQIKGGIFRYQKCSSLQSHWECGTPQCAGCSQQANHWLITERVYGVVLLLPAGCPGGTHRILMISHLRPLATNCLNQHYRCFSGMYGGKICIIWRILLCFEVHLAFKGLFQMPEIMSSIWVLFVEATWRILSLQQMRWSCLLYPDLCSILVPLMIIYISVDRYSVLQWCVTCLLSPAAMGTAVAGAVWA